MYLEPWHADVFEFIELRKNHGKEEQRARPSKSRFMLRLVRLAQNVDESHMYKQNQIYTVTCQPHQITSHLMPTFHCFLLKVPNSSCSRKHLDHPCRR